MDSRAEASFWGQSRAMDACFQQQHELIQTKAGLIEIACTGEGQPLLSVHGGPGGCDQGLVLAMPFVRAGFRVIAPSRPGYLGTPLDSGASPAHQADLLAALLDALAIDSIPVVGASAGGPPVYLLAQRHPQRVSALAVIDGVTQTYSKADQLSALEQAIFLSRPGLWLMDWLGRHFPEVVAKNLLATESNLSPGALTERVIEGGSHRSGLLDCARSCGSATAGHLLDGGLNHDPASAAALEPAQPTSPPESDAKQRISW